MDYFCYLLMLFNRSVVVGQRENTLLITVKLFTILKTFKCSIKESKYTKTNPKSNKTR